MRAIYSPRASFKNLIGPVPIDKGGHAGTTPDQAALNLGAISRNKLNIPNGVAQLDANGSIPSGVIPGSQNQDVPTVVGATIVVKNSVNTYTITNFDSFKTYTLSAISGTVTRNGVTITFTAPASAGTSGLVINGKQYPIEVSNTSIVKPSITSPVNNATNIGQNITITSSAFSLVVGSDTHLSSDWQVATDSAFTNVVVSAMDDTTNKTSKALQLPTANTDYYLRVRYKGTAYGYSDWSSTVKITTKTSFLPISEVSKLLPSDIVAGKFFSEAVAIDDTGTRVVITTYSEPSFYIFVRSGTTWTQETKFTVSGLTIDDQFGISVSMDSTGTRIVVGAPGTSASGYSGTGSVFVFTRSGTTWTQEARIDSPLVNQGVNFGCSVAIDSTGTRIAVGASKGETGTLVNSDGAVWIFTRSGATWTQEAKLIAYNDDTLYGFFGYTVAADSTMTRIVIGAPGKDNGGAVYIFVRSGTTWTQEAKLHPSAIGTSANFGGCVDIDSSGTRIVVGAPADSYTGINQCGSVFVFVRSGTTWTQEQKIYSSAAGVNYYFGKSVTINSDGSLIVVGEDLSTYPNLNYTGAGDIQYYNRLNNGTSWTFNTRVFASDVSANCRLGYSSSMTPDNSYLIVGARGANISGSSNVGAAYIFN